MQTNSFSLPKSTVINFTNGLLARFLDICGWKNCKRLPLCVVSEIYDSYPDVNGIYTGFCEADH